MWGLALEAAQDTRLILSLGDYLLFYTSYFRRTFFINTSWKISVFTYGAKRHGSVHSPEASCSLLRLLIRRHCKKKKSCDQQDALQPPASAGQSEPTSDGQPPFPPVAPHQQVLDSRRQRLGRALSLTVAAGQV